MNPIFRPWYVYACVGLVLSLGGSVFAHGYSLNPPARSYLCASAGGQYSPADGSGVPNPACRAAYTLTSDPMLYTQVHEYAINIPDYRNQAAVQAAVPDGLLCSGGQTRYRGMSIARADWEKTAVPRDGGRYPYSFNAAVPHDPSYFEIYLSKPGYDAGAKALGWGDVELLGTFENVPLQTVGGARVYPIDVNLPSDRAGDEAVLFVRWQRIDQAGEGFYSCSDVVFGSAANPNPPAPPTNPEPPTPDPNPPTPPTEPTDPPAPPIDPGNGEDRLSVVFDTGSSWEGGFNGTIRVTNNGAAVADWTLEFTLAGGASAGQSVWGAGGSISQGAGGSYTVTPNAWGGASIASGETVVIGYSGSGQHQGAQSCKISGGSCD